MDWESCGRRSRSVFDLSVEVKCGRYCSSAVYGLRLQHGVRLGLIESKDIFECEIQAQREDVEWEKVELSDP